MLAEPNADKDTWLSRLSARPMVHHAIRVLHMQELARIALGLHPVKRRLPKTGATYRVRFLESFLVADEIFGRSAYGPAFEGLDVRTFVDLGSNVGYFPVFAAEFTGRRDLVGLCIDGNQAMAEESAWHIRHNDFPNVKALWGIVGYPKDVTEAPFYLNPSNVSCSAQPVRNPLVPVKGPLTQVSAPAIDVGKAWIEHAGDRPVDVLKIDVEGFEREVVGTCDELLERTVSLVVERHKWITPEEELESLLRVRGFERFRTIYENPNTAVVVYRRTQTMEAKVRE